MTWAWARGDWKSPQQPQGRLSGAQAMDLKEQTEKEVDRAPSRSLSKRLGDAWRPAPEDIQLPNLPFIYCIFDSEHLIESLLGWPQRPCL